MKTPINNLLKDIVHYKSIALSTLLELPSYRAVKSTLIEQLKALEDLGLITSVPSTDGTQTIVAGTEAGLEALRYPTRKIGLCTLSKKPQEDADITEVLLRLNQMPNIKEIKTVHEMGYHDRGKHLYGTELEAVAYLNEGRPHRRLWICSVRSPHFFREEYNAQSVLQHYAEAMAPMDTLVLVIWDKDAIWKYRNRRINLPAHLHSRVVISDKEGTGLLAAQAAKSSAFEPKNSNFVDLSAFAEGAREAYE